MQEESAYKGEAYPKDAIELLDAAKAALNDGNFDSFIKHLDKLGGLAQKENLTLVEEGDELTQATNKFKLNLKLFVLCWRDRGAVLPFAKKVKPEDKIQRAYKEKAGLTKSTRQRIKLGLDLLMYDLGEKDWNQENPEWMQRVNALPDEVDAKGNVITSEQITAEIRKRAFKAINGYLPLRQRIITRVSQFIAIIFGFACGLTTAKFALLFAGGLTAAAGAATLPIFGIIIGAILTVLLASMFFKLGSLKSTPLGAVPAILVALGSIAAIVLATTMFVSILPMAIVIGAGIAGLIATTAYNIRLLFNVLPEVMLQIAGGDKPLDGLFSFVNTEGNIQSLETGNKIALSVTGIVFVIAMSLAMAALTLVAVASIPAGLTAVLPAIAGFQTLFMGMAFVSAGVTFFALMALFGKAFSNIYKTIVQNVKAEHAIKVQKEEKNESHRFYIVRGISRMIYNHFKSIFVHWEQRHQDKPKIATLKKRMVLIGMPLVIGVAITGLVFLCLATVNPIAGLLGGIQALGWIIGMGISLVGQLPFVIQSCATAFEKIVDAIVDHPWTSLFGVAVIAALAGGVVFALVNPFIALGLGIIALLGFTSNVIQKIVHLRADKKARAAQPPLSEEGEGKEEHVPLEEQPRKPVGQRIDEALEALMQKRAGKPLTPMKKFVAVVKVLADESHHIVNAVVNALVAIPVHMAAGFQMLAALAAGYMSYASEGGEVERALKALIEKARGLYIDLRVQKPELSHEAAAGQVVYKLRGEIKGYREMRRELGQSDKSSDSEDEELGDAFTEGESYYKGLYASKSDDEGSDPEEDDGASFDRSNH